MPDGLDMNLIRELQKDSRQTNITLAKQLHVSEATVRRRVNELKKNETVKFTVVMQPEKLGFSVSAVMLFRVDPLRVNEISDRLAQIQSFYSVIVTSGEYNVVVLGYFESIDSIYNLITTQINKIEGIIGMNTLIVMKRKKRAY